MKYGMIGDLYACFNTIQRTLARKFAAHQPENLFPTSQIFAAHQPKTVLTTSQEICCQTFQSPFCDPHQWQVKTGAVQWLFVLNFGSKVFFGNKFCGQCMLNSMSSPSQLRVCSYLHACNGVEEVLDVTFFPPCRAVSIPATADRLG